MSSELIEGYSLHLTPSVQFNSSYKLSFLSSSCLPKKVPLNFLLFLSFYSFYTHGFYRTTTQEFILSLDSKTSFIWMWLTEVCQHKSFFVDITPDTLDWVRNCFKALLDTSTTKHFFTERWQEDNCMWLRKTKNKSKTAITVEIFRIDNKGRKCSILHLI